MKIRTDFVTNSSSSSFILVFDTEKSVKRFTETCENDNYPEMLALAENCWCDALHIMNDSANNVDMKEIMPEIKKRLVGATQYITDSLDKCLERNPVLKRWDSLFISLMRFGEPAPGLSFSGGVDEFRIGDIEVSVIDNRDKRDKAKIKDVLEGYASFDLLYKMKHENIKQEPGEDYRDYIKRQDEYVKTKEVQDAVKQEFENKKIPDIEARIDNAYAVFCGTVWDTSGGTFEWAVRNGFLKDAFRSYCVMSENVG